jgi:hypothetical protein
MDEAANANAADPTPGGLPGVPDASAAAETVAERDARFMRAIDQVTAISREAALADAPGRFSLLELMVVVTLLAVTLSLVRGLGIWGGLITFVVSVVWTNLIYPQWRPADQRGQPAMFDCVWGLLMPAVCLVCDPIVFKQQPDLIEGAFDLTRLVTFKPSFRSEGLAVYCLVAWQMLFLILWLVGRPWLSLAAGFFLGTWGVGIVFVAVMGVLLVVPSATLLVVGVGLLGFTPLFSTYTLARRIREAIDVGFVDSETSATVFWLLAAFGFMAAWVAPLQIAAQLRLFID